MGLESHVCHLSGLSEPYPNLCSISRRAQFISARLCKGALGPYLTAALSPGIRSFLLDISRWFTDFWPHNETTPSVAWNSLGRLLVREVVPARNTAPSKGVFTRSSSNPGCRVGTAQVTFQAKITKCFLSCLFLSFLLPHFHPSHTP